MEHFQVTFKPDGKQISIHAGATLLEAAGQAGIILNTVCGGKGICKKCTVNLEPDSIQVLACQSRVQSNLTVTVPQSSRFFEHRILEHGIDTKLKITPTIYEKYRAKSEVVFGLAVDIGTTTVVAKLIDMTNGSCLDTKAALNPQAQFGDDVISRIAYARNKGNLAELHNAIINCINDLIAKLCKETTTSPEHIYELCAVGNTTMNHIFLEFPITQLGQAPYKAHSLDAHDVHASQSGLHIYPEGNVHTVENIAGYVGSDTTAVALAVDLDSTKEPTLTIDIGTNGEIILAAGGKLYAASCAAGPAFEGARITCGSRAVDGAIEAVVVNKDDIDVDVIGGVQPHSICGSGLIDAVAVLLDLGIIDVTGRFASLDTLRTKLPQAILSRVYEQNGEQVFVLADSASGKVFLTQKDIREVQLAKAAIRAGIKILRKKLGIKDDDIAQVYLAGAFGNYIRPASAKMLGLLPDIPVERIHFVGNAAASGAQMILISQLWRDKARELARKIKYVEIAHELDFQTVFADSMSF